MNLEKKTLESLEFNIIVNWIEDRCNSIGGKEYAINYKSNQTKDSINLNLNYSNEILQSIYRKEQIIQINLPDINPILKTLSIKNSMLEINHFGHHPNSTTKRSHYKSWEYVRFWQKVSTKK